MKPWYASHALWACILAIVVNVLQMTLRVLTAATVLEGLAAIDWASWAITAAGLLAAVGVVIARLRAGNDPDATTTAKLTWTSLRVGVGGRAAVILVALLGLGAVATAPSCSPAQRRAAIGAGLDSIPAVCELIQLWTDPDITGSDTAASWAAAGCAVAQAVRLVVQPWVTGADAAKSSAGLTPEPVVDFEARVPTVYVSCGRVAAACRVYDSEVEARACERVLPACVLGEVTEVAVE